MLIRIVKMTFRADAISYFNIFFDERKEKIRGFDGCKHLELWQDSVHTNIFFTYSIWDNEEALSHYRNSAFFKDTWTQTKKLFEAKAEAYSINQLVVLP